MGRKGFTVMNINNWKFAGLLVVSLLFLFVTSAAAQVCTPPPSGLVAWWPANENTQDIVGGNNGTINGSISYVDGKVGKAFSSPGGVGDYIQVPRHGSLEATHVTVDAWVKGIAPGSTRYIVAKGASGCTAASYGLYTGGGGLNFYIFNGSTFVLSPAAPSTIWDGNWHHVAGSYDGTRVRLYVDGSQIGSGTATSININYSLPTSNDLFIGTYKGSCTLPFKGAIDEVEIFNRALDASEIGAIYNADSAGKCTPPVADAGPDQTIPCATATSTAVQLDGSGSSDPGGDTLAYTWTGPFPEGNGTVTGVNPTVTLPLGASTVTLAVDDGKGGTASDTVQINVNVGVTGLLPPLAALVKEGLVPVPPKAFKRGSTLPLKLYLYCGSTMLTSAGVSPPLLVGLTRLGEEIPLNTIDPDSGEANDNGLLFRYAEPNWVYNFSTKDLSTGTYEIVIQMPDGRRFVAGFVLR